MRTMLHYDAIKIEGPQKKLIEFAQADGLLEDKEIKAVERFCALLADKPNYWKHKLSVGEAELLDKLMTFPLDKLFPSLDIYRIFLMHPDSTIHFKKFEDGLVHLFKFLGILEQKDAGDPAKMLSLRCICNMFRDPSALFVLRERRQKAIEAVSQHLSNPKATVREAAITVLLNYSIAFLGKDDPEGKI